MQKRFDREGRLIVPIAEHEKDASTHEKRFVVTEAYCQNGHSLMDKEHVIDGYPGIRLKFERPGHKGEFVLSAVEGSIEKIMVSGTLEDHVKDDLFCPHCGVKLQVLTDCGCRDEGEMVVLGLSPKLDFNNAIAFCNVTGCNRGVFVKSGEVIRRVRLNAL